MTYTMPVQPIVDTLRNQWLKQVAETEATNNAPEFLVAVDREVKTMNLYTHMVNVHLMAERKANRKPGRHSKVPR